MVNLFSDFFTNIEARSDESCRMSTVSFLLFVCGFFCVCLYLQSLVAAIFSSNNDITSALSSFSLGETDYFANYVAPTLHLDGVSGV